ncbi:MAG: helix-turn-helix transcriptional regulator [Ruminococcaceae bacterium]|nr:helix-turn-helix transcriptional regulator [Oscillospiraceae bacterium]
MNAFEIGKFISELRKEKALTQKELAEKLNVTDKAVSKWETGRSAPDIALLTALSEILGVTVVDIITVVLNVRNKLKMNLFLMY